MNRAISCTLSTRQLNSLSRLVNCAPMKYWRKCVNLPVFQGLILPINLTIPIARLIALLLFVCSSCFAEYTVDSTYKKLHKLYPQLQMPAETSAELRSWQNQVYKDLGELKLAMDIYARADQKGLKSAVLLVHGGGWRSGSRQLYHTLSGRLAEKGYVVATLSYRLAHQAKYPAAVHDVRDAVRWLRLNAAKFGIDPQQIAIGGGSAGGQIASLVGVTTGLQVLDRHHAAKPEQGKVAAIIVIDGLSSFVVPLALKHENDPNKKPSSAEAWFGGRYQQLPEVWQQASPLTYVGPQTPPMLFLKSSRVRFSAGIEEMSGKLQKHGIFHEIRLLEGSPHSFWLFEPWMSQSIEVMHRFLSSLD